MTTTTTSPMRAMMEQAAGYLLEQAARKAAEREERERAEAMDAAERRAALIQWLGDLTEDLDVSAGEWTDPQRPTQLTFRLTPRAWRLGNAAYINALDDGSNVYQLTTVVAGRAVGRCYPIDATDPALAMHLLEAQQAHDAELARRVAGWAAGLAVAREPGCADNDERLRELLALLREHAPERAAEWEALYERSTEALEAWRTERAEAVAVRDAAVERYREAMEAWADEYAAVRAHNDAVRAGLRARLGDVKMDVQELEYAVVADDEDWGRHVETRTAWAVGEVAGAPGTWLVIGDGGVREWTFRHPVRWSEPQTVRPEYPHTGLFRIEWFDGEPVWTDYSPDHAAAVAEARAALRSYPNEPDWPAMSGGMNWFGQVHAVAGAARERAGGAQVRRDDVPF